MKTRIAKTEQAKRQDVIGQLFTALSDCIDMGESSQKNASWIALQLSWALYFGHNDEIDLRLAELRQAGVVCSQCGKSAVDGINDPVSRARYCERCHAKQVAAQADDGRVY